KVGLWIDESASDDQADALGKVFSGSLGGPPAALGPLLGEFLGVERAPIEFNENGLTHAVKIGEAGDIETEGVVPFGVEPAEPAKLVAVFHPAASTLTIANAKHAKVDGFGIKYEGHSAFSTDFSWAG